MNNVKLSLLENNSIGQRVHTIIALDDDAPVEYIIKWMDVVDKFNNSNETKRKELCQKALTYCKLESNRQLPIINVCEGGFGIYGRKEIRLGRDDRSIIKLIHRYSGNWTLDELIDCANAFSRVFDELIEAHGGVNAYIKINCVRNDESDD